MKFWAGFAYGLGCGLIASLPLAYALWKIVR